MHPTLMYLSHLVLFESPFGSWVSKIQHKWWYFDCSYCCELQTTLCLCLLSVSSISIHETDRLIYKFEVE